MQKPFVITAIWDSKARVFTTKSEIPGLVLEAETFEELVELAEALGPQVIAVNLPTVKPPYRIKVKTTQPSGP